MNNPGEIVCLCRHCLEKIRFPKIGVGREVQCPHCGQTTTLYDSRGLGEPSTVPKNFQSQPASPPSATQRISPVSATKKCPFCAELILKEAIKCKHCGEYVDGRLKQPQKSTASGVFGGLFLFFIVLPLGCIIGIPLLIGLAGSPGGVLFLFLALIIFIAIMFWRDRKKRRRL